MERKESRARRAASHSFTMDELQQTIELLNAARRGADLQMYLRSPGLIKVERKFHVMRDKLERRRKGD